MEIEGIVKRIVDKVKIGDPECNNQCCKHKDLEMLQKLEECLIELQKKNQRMLDMKEQDEGGQEE